MRVLYAGLTGDDVTAWQNFLRGIKPNSQIIVSGSFDALTKSETQDFQKAHGLGADGSVGPMTMAKALVLGYGSMHDDRHDRSGPNWPAPPDFPPMSFIDRQKIFGTFAYVAAPVTSNPEAITITDGWASRNIVTIPVPQLAAVHITSLQFHHLAASQLQELFVAWEQAGLLTKILTWGGSWVPRFIRGSRTVLSNHAWGTAFDINVQWNMLGTTPAMAGQKGCTRELVELANQNGFFWGGHFKGRTDGMHFECAKLLT